MLEYICKTTGLGCIFCQPVCEHRKDRKGTNMNTYRLYSQNGKTIKQDCITLVVEELLKICAENGKPKFVSYNEAEHATEIRFEGCYCDFSVLLKQ
jgi:hypothetical protein